MEGESLCAERWKDGFSLAFEWYSHPLIRNDGEVFRQSEDEWTKMGVMRKRVMGKNGFRSKIRKKD